MRLIPKVLLLLGLSAMTYGAGLNVNITGVDPSLLPSIKANLSLLQEQNYALSSPIRLRMLLQRSEQEIQTTLSAYGYYHVKVKSEIKPLPQDSWQVDYAIDLGPSIIIKYLNANLIGPGENNPYLVLALGSLPIKVNTTFTQPDYEQAKASLSDAAHNNGYFDAQFSEHKVVIDPETNSASIQLVLDTKQQYRIGNISFVQQSHPYSTAFLQRFVHFHSGDAFESSQIQALQSDLSNSGYFASVFVSPKPHPNTHTVDIVVQLSAKKPQQYTVGIGYGTETKMRGLAGWELRHITDSGQRLSAQIQASSLYTSFSTSYIIPGKDPVNDYTSVNASQSYSTPIPYTARETIVGANYTFAAYDWQHTFGLNQHFVTYSTAETSNQHAGYLIPNWQEQYVSNKSEGYWDRGFSLQFNLEGAIESVASSNSFVQSTLNYTYSLPLMASNRFFININTGATAVNNINALSPTLRFYAGGVNSIRGYSYLSLGPTDSQGNLEGGAYIGTASFNLEQRVYGNWSVLTYYDTGNAFNDLNSFDPKSGWGLGLSWCSPLGPLRFYLSQGLDLPGKPWSIDFSIGAQLS